MSNKEKDQQLLRAFDCIEIAYHFTNEDGQVEHHTLKRDLPGEGARCYRVGENSRTAEMTHREASELARGIQHTLEKREEHRRKALLRASAS